MEYNLFMQIIPLSRFLFMLVLFFVMGVKAVAGCEVPLAIKSFVTHTKLSQIQKSDLDVRRNIKSLQKLCVYEVKINDVHMQWKMTLVFNPKQQKGPFWFLPHDDEDTAFHTAVYSTEKYGGGFLSVEAKEHRYFRGQDPNRNFSTTLQEAKSCIQQKFFSPHYTQSVLQIMHVFKPQGYPYLTLHNNTNGGGVSMLHTSKMVKNYPAHKHITKQSTGLLDEDSLVYMAGTSTIPYAVDLNTFLQKGLNVKYERVSKINNDCSFSNYLALKHPHEKYYNIETEHGDYMTQKKMLDRVVNIIK